MNQTRINVRPGQFFKTVMPYSEVCMHMQIAGKEMIGQLSKTGGSVQLFELATNGQLTRTILDNGQPKDGYREFSAPILPGEAGLYSDSLGFYFYA